MSDLDPHAATLIARMRDPPPSHVRFVGERIDLTRMDPQVLGDVWSVAETVDKKERYHAERSLGGATAAAVLSLRDDAVPAFRGWACRDYLDLLSDEAEKWANGFPNEGRDRQRRACFVLTRCVDLSFDGLRTSAERLLGRVAWLEMPHLALALGRLASAAVETRVIDHLTSGLAKSPVLVDELRLAASLDLSGNLLLADIVSWEWHRPEPTVPAPRFRLSDLAPYVDFAETTLRRAAEQVRAIHDGKRPYASDKAFTPSEAKVVGRSLRVALDRDETWVSPVLDELFTNVSIAPTSAKTLPSQAVAIELGQAIEAYPTPEAVVILRKVLREIRHAGVEKKLQRSLREAERGLTGRMAIALRLPPGQPVTQPQLTTLTRALEASFNSAVALSFEDWRTRLAEHPHAKHLAASLVWRILRGSGDGDAVLPIVDRGTLVLEDVEGNPVATDPACRLTLWHPATATAEERDAWRDRVAILRIRQPFKQVFREHYALPADQLAQAETAMFSGHAISLKPFLGLARREGWHIEDGVAIARPVGRWTVTLHVADEIHPGVTGWTTTRGVNIWAVADPKWLPGRFDDLSVVALSETLRSVDLLISTGGFAITSGTEPPPETTLRHAHLERLGNSPLGLMGQMRKEALKRVLAGENGMVFDTRHLRIGPYAIHLATGRVTRDGDPVTIDVPKRSPLAAVPWLPYDEKLLDIIVYTAMEIARRSEMKN